MASKMHSASKARGEGGTERSVDGIFRQLRRK